MKFTIIGPLNLKYFQNLLKFTDHLKNQLTKSMYHYVYEIYIASVGVGDILG